VSYAGDRASRIYTDSDHFRTSEGIGVGAQIPPGPCLKTASTSCAHHWDGFVYEPALTPRHSGTWVHVGCYGGVPVSADLEVERNTVKNASVQFGTSKGQGCDEAAQRPLSATDRRAITAVIEKTVARPSATVYISRVSRFVLPRSTRSYVLVNVDVKDKGTNRVDQGFAAILRRTGLTWMLVSDGTDEVGCGVVPIKYVAEMGLSC
jgi:hypothetical protein